MFLSDFVAFVDSSQYTEGVFYPASILFAENICYNQLFIIQIAVVSMIALVT